MPSTTPRSADWKTSLGAMNTGLPPQVSIIIDTSGPIDRTSMPFILDKSAPGFLNHHSWSYE
jgi:hypothetical protein